MELFGLMVGKIKKNIYYYIYIIFFIKINIYYYDLFDSNITFILYYKINNDKL